MDYIIRLSCIKNTLLVVYLIFILILVLCIISSVALHGINPTLFLLTIFDLNTVIQLSESLQTPKEPLLNVTYIAIRNPSPRFLFIGLVVYLVTVFNQVIAIFCIFRRHNCMLVFTLITNVIIFCISINLVKTNLLLLLLIVVVLTIIYTLIFRQTKNNVHIQEPTMNHPYSIINSHSRAPEHYSRNPTTIDAPVQMYQQGHNASNIGDPKILAPIIYCPHYTESVC